MKNKITLAVIGRNSSAYLKKFNKIFNNFNEVLYIDDYSKDNSIELCKKYNIRYFKRKLNNDFSSQRNFALKNANSDWVLFLDTDEYINEKFINEVNESLNKYDYDGYYIKRDYKFIGKDIEGTEMGSDKVVRLAKRNIGLWKRKVHEFWDINGNIGFIDTPIIHETTRGLYRFINKIIRYQKLHYEENELSGKKPGITKVIFYPFLKFLKNYIFLHGYRDGLFGFVISVLMSFHSFLSWSNYWLKRSQ